MNRGSRIDIVRAEEDPAAVFATPQDVVDHKGLSRDEKLRILERWRLDALDMEVATEENMAGGEQSMLYQVTLAIEALHGETPHDGTRATKHGF